MLKCKIQANWLNLYKIAMLISTEVPVRSPEATIFYSQGIQSPLWSMTVQAATRGLFIKAEIVCNIVPILGPLDCTTRELEHLRSRKQAAIRMEAISWGTVATVAYWVRGRQTGESNGDKVNTGVPEKKKKMRSPRRREWQQWYIQSHQSNPW